MEKPITAHIDYVEREAAKNMDFHLKNWECLNKEANTTLSFLFLVVSASFAGAVRLFESTAPKGWAIALCGLCVYLSCLAARLTLKCLWADDIQPASNEPKNLKLNGNSSEQIREAELDNLQKRIELNIARNERTAKHLNQVRLLICASPIVFITVVGIGWICSPGAVFHQSAYRDLAAEQLVSVAAAEPAVVEI